MFSPKILPKNEYSLRIMDNKTIQQLSKADQDIFVREYFKKMKEFLGGPIGSEPRNYRWFIGDVGEPFMGALYEQSDYTVIENHLLDAYKNIIDLCKKTKSPSGFNNGLISHFLFRLNLIINNLYPHKNNPQFDLDLDELTKKSALSSFKRLQDMVADPLPCIIEVQQDKLREKVELFLIDNSESDCSNEFIESALKSWLNEYPSRVNHAEVIKTAFIYEKQFAKYPGIAELTERLLTVHKELMNHEINSKASLPKPGR
jgi:hypothetical protein